ncbi:hypothetical protein ACFVTM_07800 [Arthrobacter sp. NPDC058130]|uniref:hypothetical protein n=1 Tax=Arthrobacter sp. NPDC058130 TaxID=3346353 RepID=UPI0036ED5975
MNSIKRNITGGVRKAATAALATALLLGATACGPSGAGSPAAGQGTAAAPSATATATSTPSATASTTAGQASAAAATTPAAPAQEKWQTYTSAVGKVSFDYPEGWTVATPAGAGAPPNVDVDVSDAAGMVVASLHYGPSGTGLGGACQNPVPYSVLDAVELALPYNAAAADTITPRFAFRALLEADRVTASYGITGSLAGKDGKSCMFYNVVSGPAESPVYSFADTVQVNTGGSEQNGNRKGAKTFPSLEAAKAYMQTPEYVNAKRMITSLKISAS